jgi:hypothetical protein
MSRILVVEPRNILRQAIGLALFPDHEVQMAAWLSDRHATVAQEFDLVIVDSARCRDEYFEQSARPCGAIVEGPDDMDRRYRSAPSAGP